MISDQRYCAPIMTIAERRAALGKAPVHCYYFAGKHRCRAAD